MKLWNHVSRKSKSEGGVDMKLLKGALAMLFVAALLFVSAPVAMAQEGTPEAQFEVSKVKLEPSETSLGQAVTIMAAITNTGDAEGSYSAELKVNGKVEETQEVTLVAGETEVVTFTYIPPTEGTYTIGIGDKTASLKVTGVSGAKFRVGPVVYLRPAEDTITTQQDGLIELYMDNPSVNDVTLRVDVRVHAPSGLHVYGQGFGLAGAAGTLYGQLEVRPGSAQTVYMNIKASESAVGKTFFVHFSGLYYPDDNKDLFNPISLTHPIKVEGVSPNPHDPTPTNEGQIPQPSPSGWPWWAWVVIAAVVLGGIGTIVAVRSRHTEVSIEK